MQTHADLPALAAQFARARVPLRIAEAPFVRGVSEHRILQMDIRKRRKGNQVEETLLLWPGEGTTLRVLGTDSACRQVVLLVREPRRRFVVRLWERGFGYREFVETTPSWARRYLVGMDERHLFIAQLEPGATTVADAHRQLRPEVVRAAELRGARVRRQGEWFFLDVTPEERAEIELLVRRAGTYRDTRLGSAGVRGRPHVASEVVRVGDIQYARGRIRHPDHATLRLRDWARVAMNTEQRGPAIVTHSSWVD